MKISGEKQLGFLSNLAYIVFRLQEPFTDFRVKDNPEIKPCIYALWHGHQFCVHGIKDRANLNILISRSIDGEIIARITEKWGFKTVRGSKGKKGSVEATMQLINKLKNGECVAMAVDGPSGPAFVVKDGIIKIAKMAGVPIVPMYWYSPFKNFLKMPSWDSLGYPLGPCRILSIYGEPIHVDANNTDEQDEEARVKLQAAFDELAQKIPQAYKEEFKFRLWKKKN
ncbi:MAG: DUF374 domain-containing protein [Candidatus Gastranaerophilales bacterium]|nr:DUF374 domain-containing protein [Candidatus Gastranaerophilales bacterium]